MTSTAIPLYEVKETFYVPYFEIQVRGNPMPRNVVRDVIEVHYEDSIEKVDSFTITINNWDADEQRIKYLGMPEKPKSGSQAEQLAKLFEPGNELALWMGYRENQRLMMSGLITTVELDFPESKVPTLVIRGLNVLDRFRQKQFTWKWPAGADPKKTIRDSEIALDLGRPPDEKSGRPGLGIEVRIDKNALDKEAAEPYVFMNNQYPIVFLMERARRHGYSIFIGEERQGKQIKKYLYFGPSQALRDITYKLEWGKSLVSFKPTLTTTNQVSEVTVCGWDRKAKQKIAETVTVDQIEHLNDDLKEVAKAAGRKEVITDRPVHTKDAARKLAKDLLTGQLKEIVEGSGVTVGLPDLRAGRSVEIAKIGYRLSGRFFIIETSHLFNEQGYRTTFKARREETGSKV
jgi:phage protein D